jgi:hypothetical protein
MEQLIPDTTTDARLAALERFLERWLGARAPEYGATEGELQSVQMPDPLRRFFRFAGRWPGHNPETLFPNRFCMQDQIGAIIPSGHAPQLQLRDDLLVFVWENQSVWVAATKPTGIDPPVWISENASHLEPRTQWRQLTKPLSHFLVSFVLQEVMFGGCELVATASAALETFQQAGKTVEPVWINGEYACDYDLPSYYLISGHILLRRALDEADGDDWYACNNIAGVDVVISLGLPTSVN